MTWGEFKAAMDTAGVQDTDTIGYIDVGDMSGIEVRREVTNGIGRLRVLDDLRPRAAG
jgi:hypothetical protein